MVSPERRREPAKALIAGYTDLSREEFATHYQNQLDHAIQHSDSFLLSAESGACTMSFEYLKGKGVRGSKITVYQSTATGTNERELSGRFPDAEIHAVPGGEAERLSFMCGRSNYNIDWLRPSDALPSMSAIGVLDARFSGPREAKRLRIAKGVLAAMAYYDTIV